MQYSCHIEFIAEQLKKELPGLRGFSARNIRNMRKFWEEWHDLLSNSADSIMRVQSVPDMEQLRNLLIQSNVKENHSESD